MERDLQSLLDILQSAQIVMNYVAGRSQDELTTDLQLQDAIIRRLLIIGEASKRVSEKTQQALTKIPWAAINGMRNRLGCCLGYCTKQFANFDSRTRESSPS
jgi:uncharacterized protein with HEPN domain